MKGETNMRKNTIRKDDRGRILNMGESQKNGRYLYKYTDNTGKVCYVYSNRLKPSDKTPPGGKPDLSLREKIDKIERDRLDGIITSDMTVYELVERYLATKESSVRESTKRGYETVMNFLKTDPIADKRIDRIKTSDAKLWFIKLQREQGKRYSTLCNIRGVLRPAFNLALEDDLIRKNPFQFHLSSVIVNDSVTREALIPEEEREFLRFLKEDPHYRKYFEVFYILLNTGLRISEFCGLTIKDVDYKKGEIRVTGQLTRYKDMTMHFETTKTRSGIRKIPMSPEVAQCFKTLWKKRSVKGLIANIDGKTGFFCYDQHGKPKVALHWQKVCNRIVEKHNETCKMQLPNITPHVLRHTFCTKMARLGMTPKALQEIMGHSEIAVTMDTYTHLTTDDVKKEFMRVMQA